MSDEDSFVILDTLSLGDNKDDNSDSILIHQSLTAADGVGNSSIKNKLNSGDKSLIKGLGDESERQQTSTAQISDIHPEMKISLKDSQLWQRAATSTTNENAFENSITEGKDTKTASTKHSSDLLASNSTQVSLFDKSKLSNEPEQQETSISCKVASYIIEAEQNNDSPLQSWLTVNHPPAEMSNTSIKCKKNLEDFNSSPLIKQIDYVFDVKQTSTPQIDHVQPEMAEEISVKDSKLWQRATAFTTNENGFGNFITEHKDTKASKIRKSTSIYSSNLTQESLPDKSKISIEPEKQNNEKETSTSCSKTTPCVTEAKGNDESPLQSWLTISHSAPDKAAEESKLTSSSAANSMEEEESKEKSLEISSGSSGPPSVPSNRSSNNNLAASFILGEVNVDVLKTSVYSQFPSISMQASAEDIVKLQNLLTEHTQLQTTLAKFTNTMQQYHRSTLQYKEERQKAEKRCNEQLKECQKQIQQLQNENAHLKKNIETQLDQIKALDVVRQKDREDMIQSISEKSALIENMRVQIEKLEQSQLASYEVLATTTSKNRNSSNEEIYIKRDEHVKVVKRLQSQLSELLAKNLDFKDVEKQYIDELNCLKVNLAAAEELIKRSRAEIQEVNANKQEKIESLNQRITLLEQRNEVHRRDFEIEQQSRVKAVGEKQLVLKDLRILQKRNQQLIEERQNQIEQYGTSAAAFPIQQSSSHYRCPVCDKVFKSLMILHGHVNECIDNN
uniref:CC2-LZ domain-containing protein n=1 Tax=Glossina brevipalpis TaxID=37001 RepID=A0A1A9WJX5_9MUSC